MPGARVFAGNRSGAYEIHQQFAAYDGERLYGLGQRTHGRLNLKGLALDLVQRNGEVSIPFVLSDRGYGLLWNVPAVGRVEFADNATRWQAGPGARDRLLVHRGAHPGGHPRPVRRRHRPRPRAARLGERLLAVQAPLPHPGRAARCRPRVPPPRPAAVGDRRRLLPLVRDGRLPLRPGSEWPDPAAMVAELRELGVELMVSIWPTVSPLSENYAEFFDQGLLVGADQGVEFQQTIQDKGMAAPMPVAFYDPTNPADPGPCLGADRAQLPVRRHPRLLARRVRAGAQPGAARQPVPVRGPGRRSRRHLPARQRPAVRRGHGRRRAARRRSCCAAPPGPARRSYGAAVWSGDIPATWESLRQQVRAGLNIAISGIPWWTTDIGGFHGGDPADPAYQELIVRWFQYGVFCPLFRLHGDRLPRVPTGLRDDRRAQRGLVLRRRRVRADRRRAAPARTAAAVHPRADARGVADAVCRRCGRCSSTSPHDPGAWHVEDQFMFGPDLLVAPVLEPGATDREVYLPAGRAWIEAGDRGAARRAAPPSRVPLSPDRIPVFVARRSRGS